jgi:ABC-type transporter Mla MlaB component
MSEPKDSSSFFRKVVKFVANPATDWNELSTQQQDVREQEFAKSELKAMIERKRRNDFVRKREFDMLRKVRREGLSGEQIAALAGSSRLDDSESRVADYVTKQDAAVKAKIDAIEQQMVGDGIASPARRSPALPPASRSDFFTATTKPAPIGRGTRSARTAPLLTEVVPPSALAGPKAQAVDPAMALRGLQPIVGDSGVEVSEVVHDPDLDEAVIAFANADFEACEHSLSSLTATHGARAHHAETWLVLFDLYRSIGQHAKFEALAIDYAHQFGWSAPQWYSLPQQVAEAAAEARSPVAALPAPSAAVGWAAPDHLDRDAIARLASRALQLPQPWVLDWSALRSIDPEACARLTDLFRGWALQPLEMRWLSGEHFLGVLREAAPAGVRDVDPAVWKLRLEALRLVNRPDQFDETAIDYCVTYEVSPPSWERTLCRIKVGAVGASLMPVSSHGASEVPSGFAESQSGDGLPGQALCELSGQLAGDITTLLQQLNDSLGSAPMVMIGCARLIRVDFIAAGDLLNWVLNRKAEGRSVTFTDANRLVALFFGAMGINEHAKVRVRAT